MRSSEDFKKSLVALLEEEERTAEHLSAEQLLAYHGGQLPAAQAEEILDHVVACRECTALLEDLGTFKSAARHLTKEEGTSSPTDLGLAAFWRHLKACLRDHQEARGGRRAPLFLAAVLGATALGFGLWAVIQANHLARLKDTVVVLSQPRANPVIFDLTADIPLRDGAITPQQITLNETGLVLILTPELPREYSEYRISLYAAGEWPVWQQDKLELHPFDGSLSLLVPAGAVGTGDYRLELSGKAGDRQEPIETYHFQLVETDAQSIAPP